MNGLSSSIIVLNNKKININHSSKEGRISGAYKVTLGLPVRETRCEEDGTKAGVSIAAGVGDRCN